MENLTSRRVGLTGPRGTLARVLQSCWPEVEWVAYQGDVLEFEALQRWASGARLDALLHLAAIVPTNRVEADPRRAFLVNVAGTVNVLEAVRCPWVFLASSSHVYGSSPDPHSEDSALDPLSLYGKTKTSAEEWARVLSQRHGQKLCIGRIFSYTDPAQDASFLVPGLFRRIAAAPQQLEVFGLEGSRDFLSAREVARLIGELCQRQAEGTYNIASGQALTLRQLAQAIAHRLGRTDLELVDGGGASHLLADISRLRALGIEPRFHLDDLLER